LKKEQKITEDYKNNEWVVYVADENRKEKVVKVAKSKRAAVILYNKLIKTDKYHEVGMRVIKEQKLKEVIRKMIEEDFAGALPAGKRKSFDSKRRKQSEVLGYKLTGKNDMKTETDDATVHQVGHKKMSEGFADNFMKSVDKHNQKIVDNALALSKQQAIKDKQKGSKNTPKLIAIKTINNMKTLRNKTKSPALKQAFQKTIGKLEKDYKKIKEGKLTEGRKDILLEKKDLDPKSIQKVAKLTDRNNHTEARLFLAHMSGDKKLMKAYEGLKVVQDYMGRANEIVHPRRYLDLKLKDVLSRKFSNFDEIWSNL